jgi:hypothetical protein
VAIIQASQIYMDLTGRFPRQPSSRNKYILSLYEYDGNTILTHVMNNQRDKEMVAVFEALICVLTYRRLNPQVQCLDNEASRALTRFLASHEIDFQVNPPDMHLRHAAERVI